MRECVAAHNGPLQSMTYGNGHVVSYGYDHLDRVTKEYWNNTLKYQYFYNSEGNLSKKLDVTTQKAVNYEYDSLGRLIYSWQTSGNSIVQKTEHLYDTENRIVSQSWQLGSTAYSESYTYDADDGSLATMTPAVYTNAANKTITFTYDDLKRLSTKTHELYKTTFTYNDDTTNKKATTQVAGLSYAKVGSSSLADLSFTYGYDNLGNIASVNSGVDAWDASYTYDQLGQLKTEVNSYGKYTYVYDTAGNILSVKNTDTNALIHSYTYGDNTWLDKLTAFDNETITYDAIGNPTSYYNGTRWTFGWSNGRQLTSASGNGKTISYTYDVAGIRDSKTVNGTTYTYLTQNGQVVRQSWGSNVLDIIYDNQSKPYALIYNGTTYYYILNLQGDVIRIVNSSGGTVADYVYDAWGNPLNGSGYASTHLYHINPIRYRGYYYDTETGLYYLQSRYYDPVVKRFINADGYASTGQGFGGYNMFIYCNNNPTGFEDSSGNAMNTSLCVADTGSNKRIKATNNSEANNIVGANTSVTTTLRKNECKYSVPMVPISVTTGEKTTTTVTNGNSGMFTFYHAIDASNPTISSTAGASFAIDGWQVKVHSGWDNLGTSLSYSTGPASSSMSVSINLAELKLRIGSTSSIKWDTTSEIAYTNIEIDGWGILAYLFYVSTGTTLGDAGTTYTLQPAY